MDDRLTAVVAWLRQRKPGLGEIPPGLDLIEHRIVDSLDLMEFILLLEDLAGREFSQEEMDVTRFRSLEAIQANVLEAGGPDMTPGPPTGVGP